MSIDREKRFLYNSKDVAKKLRLGYPAKGSGNDGEERVITVSYTHLTLPTIYSV